MKKLSKLAALAAGLIVAALAGCSDISSGGMATEGYTDAKSSLTKKTLTLNVTSDSDLVKFKTADDSTASARTIAPDAVDSDDLIFYLGGTNLVTNKAIDLKNVTFVGINESTTEGTVTVELDATNYRFTLIALPKNTIVATTENLEDLVKKAYLIGYASADLRYTEEAASVNFVLSADGLTGSGTVDFKIYLDNWSTETLALVNSDNEKVIAAAITGLYDIQSGVLIEGTALNPSSYENKYAEATALAYTANNKSLAAGTYDLTVTFTTQNRKTYIYSEKVVILPNQVTKATIAIPEVIDKQPEVPTNFKVGYIKPTYNDSDYYRAVFNWEDKSSNELYFEIELYDISGSTALGAYSANIKENWSASATTNSVIYSNSSSNPNTGAATTVFYGLKSDNGPNWYAGSLNRNNEFAVFYMELGKKYFARIRAVNEAGNSEWSTTTVSANSYSEAAVGNGTTTDAEGNTAAVTNFVNAEHEAYCISAETTYGALITAAEATRTEKESATATKFNTEVINLFCVTYELAGGTFQSPASLATTYYFDQLVGGNPIMQPDGVRVIKLSDGIINTNQLIYNGKKIGSTITNAVISLKYGTGSAEKSWTSWKVGSVSGSKYPSDYTACTTATVYNEDETYYKLVGTDYAVTTVTKAPDAWDGYFTGTLTPYTGYENLVLYANYTSNTFGVQLKNVADYLIENNLSITATLSMQGTGDGVIKTSASDLIGKTSVKVVTTTPGYDSVTIDESMIKAATNTYYKKNGTATNAAFWAAAIAGKSKVYASADDATGDNNAITVTADMINAATKKHYTANDGTDTEVSWGSLRAGDVVYKMTESGTATPEAKKNDYIIIDQTQKPVTYTVKEVTDNMRTAGAQGYFRRTYKSTDISFWTGTVGTKYYTSEDGDGEAALADDNIKKAGAEELFQVTYKATDASFWSSTAAGKTLYSDTKGTTVSGGVTQAMINAATGAYYTEAYDKLSDVCSDAAAIAEWFEKATVGTTKVYSSASDTTGTTVIQTMVDAATNKYYQADYVAADYDFYASATAGVTKVYDKNDGTGNEIIVNQAMIKAGTQQYYQADGYAATDADFWKKAAVGSNVYEDNTGSTSKEVSETMIKAGSGAYYTANDGTDTVVSDWGTSTVVVYEKTVGEAITLKNILFTYNYISEDDNGKDNAVTYEKVILEVLQEGSKQGTSVGTFTASGNDFTVPVSGLTGGTYMLVFKGYVPSSNVKVPYEYTVYLVLND